MRVNPTGSVEVLTGSHSHGQGHETTFAQLVASGSAFRSRASTIVHGDTDKVQFGMGTYGSRSGAVGMSAVVKALDKVEAKAKKIAAHLMEAAEGDIEFKDGKFTVAGTDKSMAFGEVALGAYVAHKFPTGGDRAGAEGRLPSTIRPTSPSRPAATSAKSRWIPTPVAPRSSAWTAVDDFGTVINPMIVEGQVHGGIAQGVGQALLEAAVYDANGQLVSGSLMDYAMPHAENFPAFQDRHDGDQVPLQSARHQGLRRGGGDRFAGGADQCDHRRHRQRGGDDAGDGAGGLGGVAEIAGHAAGGIEIGARPSRRP